LPVLFTRKLRSSGGNGLYRTNPGAGAAVLAFGGIYPAVIVLFRDGLYRTFTVAGTAVNTLITYLVCHDIPLSGKYDTLRIYRYWPNMQVE
jgi:hypothetical protein